MKVFGKVPEALTWVEALPLREPTSSEELFPQITLSSASLLDAA